MYNAITRSVEAELFPALKRYGLAFYAYNPLAGGLLTSRYKALNPAGEAPSEGRFSDHAGNPLGERYRERYFHRSIFEALRLVDEEASHHNMSMVQTALRWLVHHSPLKVKDNGPDGVILGVSSLGQLQENLDALEQGPLPTELLDALDQAWKVAKSETPNYWHGKLEYSYDTRKALFNI